MTVIEASLLSQDIRDRIDQWVQRYPSEQQRSGVFEALRLVQEQHGGSLTPELMEAVANHLGMPSIAVYEVATFYSLFHLQAVGRHIIDICTNISCSLRGAEELVAHVKKRLGIEFNETTADGRFTLREVECLGACAGAPACMIGKKYYEQVTSDSMDSILEGLSNGK